MNITMTGYLVAIEWLFVHDVQARAEANHNRQKSRRQAKRQWIRGQKAVAAKKKEDGGCCIIQ